MKLRHSLLSILLSMVLSLNLTGFHIIAEENPEETGGEAGAEVLEQQDPEETSPEETVSELPEEAPGETPQAEEEINPEETPLPEEITPDPQESLPAEGEVPAETGQPEETALPEESALPEETPLPEETALPEETVLPEETPDPESEGEKGTEEIDVSDIVLQAGGFPADNEGSTAEAYNPKDYDDWKPLCDALVAGMTTRKTEIDIREYNLPASRMREMYGTILNTNPQLFFVKASVSFNYETRDGVRYAVMVVPRYDSAYSVADYEAFVAASDKILSGIKSGWSDQQKALYLHDAVVLRNNYDLTYSKYNAYNALVEQSSVCQGYALAYLYFCNELGIECEFVSSVEMGHAWNRVKLGGSWYYVDCTWDDPVGTGDTLLFSQNCGHSNAFNSDNQHRNTNHKGSDWVNDYGESVIGTCSNSKYDSAWFKESMAPVVTIGNLSGYITNTSSDFMVYDYSSGSSRTLAALSDNKWPVYGEQGSTWTKKYWGTATDGTNFYVSGPRTIYSISTTGTLKTLYTLSSAEQNKGYIYGIYIDGSDLCYDIQQSSSAGTYQTTGSVKVGGGGDDPQPAVVEKIAISPNTNPIDAGSSTSLTVTITPAGSAAVDSLNFSSANQGIAVAESGGTVRGIAPGTTTITASTQDGKVKGSCDITVKAIDLKAVKIYASQDVLRPSQTTTLTVKYEPENATYKEVTWSSLNSDIATVDANGTVQALKAGQATIKAVSKQYSGISDTKIIQVVKPVEKVSIEDYTQAVYPGSVITLKAVIEPSDAYDQSINWSSSDTSIATVSSNGQVRFIKEGSVTITAASGGDSTKKGSITLSVNPKPVESISLNQTSASMLSGDTLQLTATTLPKDAGAVTVSWKSSDDKTATVSTSGKVTAVKAGTAVITASAPSGSKTVSASCTVTITPRVVFEITSQPSDATVKAGENASFHITATGEGLSYQWQLSRDNGLNWSDMNSSKFPSALTPDFEIKASTNLDGYLFHCVVTDQNKDKLTSSSAKLTAEAAVEITAQPSDTTVNAGEKAYFHVKASGQDLSYQWQMSKDKGSSWTSLNGTKFPSALTPDFEIKASTGNGGNLFRCVVTDSSGQKAVSNSAKLNLEALPALKITSQPSDTTVSAGEMAKFHVKASGDGLSYHWQLSRDNGLNWSGMSGTKFPSALTADMEIKAGTNLDGYLFRCVVSDTYGQKVTSTNAKLTLEDASGIEITSQPSDATVSAGEIAKFHVKASGEGLSYHWQLTRDNGLNWTSLNGTKFPSALTADFEIKASTNTDGNQFRCVITDASGQKVHSKAARLTVEEIPGIEITLQPSDTTVSSGQNAYFHVKANGDNLSYHWQMSKDDGSSWTSLNGTKFPSALTPDFEIKASTGNAGNLFRCIITDPDGKKATSKSAKLSLGDLPPLKITSHPSDTTVSAGANAQFHVKASGEGLSYHWQLTRDNGINWTSLNGTKFPSALTADFEIKGSTSTDGNQFRCVVSDSFGQKVNSNSAKLSVQ
ncbi:MAG: Ig-like domain-containing protein [Solobacterium sp.]|nr:Ig-like domain-containing protein [Solobacterium sp.]